MNWAPRKSVFPSARNGSRSGAPSSICPRGGGRPSCHFPYPLIPTRNPHLAILAFALAGLGSALLPLTVSFAEKEFTTITASVAGGLIAFYQIGYGIAAFGVGPLQSRARLEFNPIYAGTAIFALVMSALSFVLVRLAAAAPCLRNNLHKKQLSQRAKSKHQQSTL
jgi:hypothetical protein